MATPTQPPFYRYAAKAFVALGVGVVVSGGVIIAAAADDRITTSEWVQIILTVLGTLFGTGGVYKVENATKPALKLPADFVASASFRRHVDGTVDLVWPQGRGTTWIAPELLEGIVKTHNDLVRQVAPVDGSAAAQRAYPPPPWMAPK